MSEFENVLFKNLLILFAVGILIEECTISNDFKLRRFESTGYFVIIATNRELDFYNTLFVIYRIDELWFVDIPVCLAEQTK